ncbi:hypothetical protein [Paludisphaera mucosa]|uniref:Uncharacterized protein n=1 Tax=Paludisphaera mucosa TaxID=3030827 RepID=A0ABT6F668_9BACT|nr:hypothetical protein [Paludisphaera mucosa]MDG3003017.1 hypothetical protein [Paludisphaera mucosa]
MAVATDLQSASQGLAIGVSLISLFLGLRQWYEHRARWDLSELDGAFYRRQDVRRWLGVFVLASVAVVVYAGSWIEPKVEGKGNVAFVVLWLVVLVLIVVTLLVALWDWVATWLYAREKRRAMVRDHVDDLRRQLRVVAEAARSEREAEPKDNPSTEA